MGTARRTRDGKVIDWLARVRRILAGLVVGLALLLSGCSTGSEDSQDAGGASAVEAPAPDDLNGSATRDGADDEGAVEDGAAGGESEPAGRTAVQTRAVISIGEVTLQAKDLGKVRGEIDALLGRYGGFVADERTANDDEGATDTSVLTLRVPSRHFEAMMSAFEDFSTVTDTRRKATDVTTEVIDVDSRIRTQEVSLTRLRGFLERATDVNAMIRLESEIARREADLASLRAQQDYLDDQTSLATITVTMAVPGEEPEPAEDPLDDAGFLSGLSSGWNALLDALVVGATIVGALLPFAVLLGVLGVPFLMWLRSARRRRTAAPPAA